MSILFTQYLLPNGRQKTVAINRPKVVEEKAKAVTEAGLHFEAEVLRTGIVSFTIVDRKEEVDLFIELVPNGPEVLEAVDRLVQAGYDYVEARKDE